VLEGSPQEPLDPRLASNPPLMLVDRGHVRRFADQAVNQVRELEQRRDPPEHEQVAAKDQLSPPAVVDGSGQQVNRGAQDPELAASSCLGVSFFGSMNGFSTTVAETFPSGRSTSSSVPSSDCSIGTIA
jgi:hypothetical protein